MLGFGGNVSLFFAFFVIVGLQLDNQLHGAFSDGSWATILCYCSEVKVSRGLTLSPPKGARTCIPYIEGSR
jgi:hypothetical protein